MNLKITKRMISILCAATMAVSSVGASVSAIKAYPGNYALAEPPVDLKNAVDSLNNTLKSSIDVVNKSISSISNLAENHENDEDTLTKLSTIASILESIKTQIKEWDNYFVVRTELVNETKNKIDNLNLSKVLEDLKNIDKLDSINKDLQEKIKIIEKINAKLGRENQKVIFQGVASFIDNPFFSNQKVTQLQHNPLYDNPFFDRNNNKQEKNEESDTKLIKEIKKINESNKSTKEKIMEITKLLKNNEFNDYKKQLNTILPIIDSLQITKDRNVNGKVVILTEEEINNNKQLRNEFKKFLSKSIEKHIDQKINSLKSNDITKPLADHINKLKPETIQYYTNMVITSTSYLSYTTTFQLLNVVDAELDKISKKYLANCKDKNQVKNFYDFYMQQYFNKISDKNFEFNEKNFSEEFESFFREYVRQITGKRSDEEKIYFNRNGLNYYKVKDHLLSVFKKYKKLENVYKQIKDAILERVNFGLKFSSEDEVKAQVENAKKAFDDIQKCVVIIDGDTFVVIEEQDNNVINNEQNDNNNNNVINNEQNDNNNNNVINNEQNNNNNNNVINNEQNNNNNNNNVINNEQNNNNNNNNVINNEQNDNNNNNIINNEQNDNNNNNIINNQQNNNNNNNIINNQQNNNNNNLRQYLKKAVELKERIRNNISDFKKWLRLKHNIDLENNNLENDNQLVKDAKRIIDKATEHINYAENAIAIGYDNENTALQTNKSICINGINLIKEIENFKTKYPANQQ